MKNKILVYIYVFLFCFIASGMFLWGLSFILERSYLRENLIFKVLSLGFLGTFGPIAVDYSKKLFFKIRQR